MTVEAGARNRLSHEDLVSICERASWMFERLDDAFEALDGEEADRARERRLAEWKQVVADGDETRFARRLAWDRLSDADVRKALGPVRLRATSTLPAWTQQLAELAAASSDDPCRYAQPDAPLPFEHVLGPLVAVASRRLVERCGPALARFSDAALGSLERALLRRLSLFALETLHLEFTIFRNERLSSLDRLWLRTAQLCPDDVYREFVAHLREGGFRALLLEYPAMARLIATATRSWLDATAELVQRFDADSAELAHRFVTAGEVLRVVALDALLSDSHNGGRSVSILTFASGVRVVYKPRSVANERAWFALLGWLHANGAPETLRLLDVIERPGYGWVEAVCAHPLLDENEAARFYRRCGMLLALAYAIGMNDLHFENLIAAGDQPVVIDLETILCHSPIETVYGAAADDLLKTVFFESPIRTGLLPRWQTAEVIPVDVSALGAVTAQRSMIPIPQWHDVNTDLMELHHETVDGKPGPNTPLLRGEALSPNDYVDAIATGFAATYRLLVRERERMLAPGGPVHALGELDVRFIFRATAFYGMVAKSSRLPHLLRDGADRSVYLEPVAAPLLFAGDTVPLGWPLVELERRALEVEDCPHFCAPVRSAEIDDPRGGTLAGILDGPCFTQTAARLLRLDEIDLDNQLGLVRASLDSRTLLSAHAGPAARVGLPAAVIPGAPLAQDALLDEAIRVADDVLRSSIAAGGRTPHWVTLRYLAAIGKNQLDPIGSDLFEGRAGIALLFAALYRVSAHARFEDAARAIAGALGAEIAPLNPETVAPDVLVHGATGIVSLTYVFPYLAELLDAPDLLATAAHAARFVTARTLATDVRYDVLSGAAGSILGLLRLARSHEAGDALQRAVACGDHLLAQRSAGSDGRMRWETFEGRAICGFAHGNAGIAFALLRLFAASGETRFRDGAFEAIAFENSAFSAHDGNWPDLRWPQPSFAAGWCHGGPGIGLSRVEALAHGADSALARDVARASALAAGHVRDGTDHLCCGNFGRVLVLHEIGRRTHAPELVREAESLAAALVRGARERGGYRFMRDYAGHVSFPGLFQGMSGVGYALLRLGFPDTVPAFMTFA